MGVTKGTTIMGACFNYRTFTDEMPRADIKKAWESAVDNCLYENGHQYSGGIGMLGANIKSWEDKNFPTRDEAYDWLVEKHEKWQSGIAVSYLKDGKKIWMIGGWCSE